MAKLYTQVQSNLRVCFVVSLLSTIFPILCLLNLRIPLLMMHVGPFNSANLVILFANIGAGIVVFLTMLTAMDNLLDWWFLWPGPILQFDTREEGNYAECIQWMNTTYKKRPYKILHNGVIKFRDNKIAIMFKLMYG